MGIFGIKSEYEKRKERVKKELEKQEIVDNEEEDNAEELISEDGLEEWDILVLNFLNEKYPNTFFVDTSNAQNKTFQKKKNNDFYDVDVWVYNVYIKKELGLVERKLVFVSENEIYFVREDNGLV